MLTLFVGLIIGFYILVVLCAFVLAIAYFLKTDVKLKEIPQKNYLIEYIPELNVWYCYLDGKYICSGLTEKDCRDNANIL